MTTVPADSDPFLGLVIAERYAIQRRIGRGGMGAVYLARQHPLGRDVALKLIRADLVGDAEVVARFEREARAIARLSDPHIVVVYDFGQSNGSLYLAMELLNGVPLGEQLRQRGTLSLVDALQITRDICVALEIAHGNGVIHRDLKPDNIMLVTADGRSTFAKVLDFGIAKIAGGVDGAQTAARVVLGTPGYVAPDVIMGGMGEDPRADLYAVGVMLFEMLAGSAPFSATSPSALLVAQASSEAPLLSSRVAVPSAVSDLVARLTARRPELRPSSAREVIDTIDRLDLTGATAPLRGGLPTPSPPGASGSTLPLAALAGGVGAPSLSVSSSVPTITATTTGQALGPATPTTLHGVHAPSAQPRAPWALIAAAIAGVCVVAGLGIALLRSPAPQTPVAAAAPVSVPAPSPTPVAAVSAPAVAPAAPAAVPIAAPPTPEAVVTAPAPAPAPAAPAATTPTKPKPKPVVVAAKVEEPPPPPPPPSLPALTSSLVKQGIVGSVGKASACTNTNIKLAPSGPGLLIDHCPSYRTIDGSKQVALMVTPAGDVVSARFTDPAVNAHRLGACVLESLKKWKFPPFLGDAPVEISQRVTFEACVPINGVCVF
jgi:serine/threonine protein kinase